MYAENMEDVISSTVGLLVATAQCNSSLLSPPLMKRWNKDRTKMQRDDDS
jgi:hypothetical protein